jgi:ABC-type polysaccharide/polyol phosphate transport system ATPase subunit
MSSEHLHSGSPKTLIKLERVHLYLPFHRGRSATKNLIAQVGGKISWDAGKQHVVALRQVNLALSSGDRIALLGHNGAGKTSLLRVLAGIYEPSAGIRTINGSVLALLSSTIGMNMNNTGRTNIHHACALFDVPKSEIPAFEESVIEFSELGDFIDLPVKTYSAGMRTRLGFSIISGLDPDILIVDEVLSAGDMSFALKAQKRIISMIERSHAMVVASHSADLMKMFCNRAVWLDHGQIRMDGDFDEVKDAYYAEVARLRG